MDNNELSANLASLGTDCISRQAAIDAIGKKSDEIYKTKQKGATYPHDDFFQGMAYAESVVKKLPSAQTCTTIDTISRQAAIDAMCGACSDWCDEGVCRKVSAIQKLPPAQPIDVQEAYYRGKIDGIKECTARLKKMNEEFANG